MGTGKTQFTKSLVSQLLNENKRIGNNDFGVLIFDYKGDYCGVHKDFVEMNGVEVFTPYKLPFNPLSLIITEEDPDPVLLVNTASIFVNTISKIYHLGPKQENILYDCIMESYERQGIDEDDPSTWSQPAPTLSSVFDVYMENEDIKKGDSLSAALKDLIRFKVFEASPEKTKSLYDHLKGTVVIDLHKKSEQIQNLTVAIILDLLYSQMLAHGPSEINGSYRQMTKMVLVDEADNFMKENFDALKKILKEGREFGVGTILSTQFLDHFNTSESDYSKYILTWVVHNVPDLKLSDISFVFKVDQKSESADVLARLIKSLEKHHSVIKVASQSPLIIEDYPFWKYKDSQKA